MLNGSDFLYLFSTIIDIYLAYKYFIKRNAKWDLGIFLRVQEKH